MAYERLEWQILASAVRTATIEGARQHNEDGQAMAIIWDITAGTTLQLTPQIQMYLDGIDTWVDYCIDAVARTGTGRYIFIIDPKIGSGMDSPSALIAKRYQVPPPIHWRPKITHGNANNATYSVWGVYF
jgi:hypothetical protein